MVNRTVSKGASTKGYFSTFLSFPNISKRYVREFKQKHLIVSPDTLSLKTIAVSHFIIN